jgi:hypothetical protein
MCAAGVCTFARNCLELHAARPELASGIYPIDPDGAGANPPQNAWCDMGVLGGGWTLVQRTVWDWTDNAQLQTNYANWHNNTYGSPSPGRTYRIAGRAWPALQGSSPQHLMVLTPRRIDNASCLPLYYTVTGGQWFVSPTTGSRLSFFTQRVAIFDSSSWVTNDMGAPSSVACTQLYGAVPWTHASCCATCPTFGSSFFSPPRPMANYLMTSDEFGNVVSSRCSGEMPVTSSGYYAINLMEYYTR